MSCAAAANVGQHMIHNAVGHNVVKDNGASSWIPIPDVKNIDVEELAKGAVGEYNLKYNESYKFKMVENGWYQEVKGSNNLKFLLLIEVADFLGRVLRCKVFVEEIMDHGNKIIKLELFEIIEKI